jgi:hypothetical protein
MVELCSSSNDAFLEGGGSTSTHATKLEASSPLLSLVSMVAHQQQPLDRRLFSGLAAGARRFVATKWCVPSGFEVTSNDGCSPERGI